MLIERFTLRAATYLLLIRDEKVLMLRRYNTGWEDGKYTLIAGHFDGKQTIAESMSREAREEGGIHIDPKDLRVVHVMHSESNEEYIDFFLIANTWQGEPKNVENDKADDMQWFPLTKLPENTLRQVKQGIESFLKGELFSEFH